MGKFELFNDKTIKVPTPKKSRVERTKNKHFYYMLCFSGSQYTLNNLTIDGHRIVRKHLDYDKNHNAIICVHLDKKYGALAVNEYVHVQIPQGSYPGRPFMRTYVVVQLDGAVATMREVR